MVTRSLIRRDGADELRAEVQQGITLECMIDRDLQIKEKEHKMLTEMKVKECAFLQMSPWSSAFLTNILAG